MFPVPLGNHLKFFPWRWFVVRNVVAEIVIFVLQFKFCDFWDGFCHPFEIKRRFVSSKFFRFKIGLVCSTYNWKMRNAIFKIIKLCTFSYVILRQHGGGQKIWKYFFSVCMQFHRTFFVATKRSWGLGGSLRDYFIYVLENTFKIPSSSLSWDHISLFSWKTFLRYIGMLYDVCTIILRYI